MSDFFSLNVSGTQSAAATVPTPSRSFPDRRPMPIVGLALALLFSVGALIGTNATPASAASTGNVTFCLSYNNGAPYASKPVYLYKANGSSWGNYYKSGSTNAQGCATWQNLPTSYAYLTQGYWTYTVGSAGYYYNGSTGSVVLGAGGGTVRQASGWVAGPYRLY